MLGEVLAYLRRTCAPEGARDLTDGELLQRFLTNREGAAFTILLQRHGPMVLGVCRRVLRDAHDAEDAFQATFLLLARKARSLRQPEPVFNCPALTATVKSAIVESSVSPERCETKHL